MEQHTKETNKALSSQGTGFKQEDKARFMVLVGAITRISEREYLVGSGVRRVIRDGACDCPGYSKRGICSHTIAVKLFESGK